MNLQRLRTTRVKCALFLSFCLSVNLAYSQQKKAFKEITADLPDETEETAVLARNAMQVEVAFLNARFPRGEQPSIIQAFLRYGVLKRVEFRLLMEEGRARDRYMEETVQSTYPLALSAKLALLKGHGLLPNITFVEYLKLPFTSHTGEQKKYWSTISSLAFSHDCGQKWKLEYNGGVQQEAYSTDWVSFFNSSLHFKINKRWETFMEYYGQYQGDQEPKHNAGLGTFYQIGNNLGVYAVVGKSITGPSNSFMSFGLTCKVH